MNASTIALDSITVFPADLDLSSEQKNDLLHIAVALAVGADPEAIDFRIYDAATHVAPTHLAKPLVVLAGIKVEHDEHHDEHAHIVGDLGELVATVRIVDYLDRDQEVDPHEDVRWLQANTYPGIHPNLAPSERETFFTPDDVDLSLDSEAVRVVGIASGAQGGRTAIGTELPSGIVARETRYRLRLAVA